MTPINPNNYWVSSPYPHPVAYPKMMFHDTEPARQVSNPDEELALGPEWSDSYADHKRDYPKAKFRLKKKPEPGEIWYEVTTVETPEDEGNLEGDWSDTVPPEPATPAAQPQPL